MARDIEFIQDDDGNWDIDFASGDFKMTDGLDTALYLSIFAEKRASASEVTVPQLRRGHFTDEFSSVEGYQMGNTSWIEIDQAKDTDSNVSLIESKWTEGLSWMIEDNIVAKTSVSAIKESGSITAEINLTNQSEQDSSYFNLFINTFN